MSTTYLATSRGVLHFEPLARVHEYTFTLSEIATCLSRMVRFNGHMGADTVAGHSVRVWSALAAHDPYTRVVGLLHDAAEAYVGDMPGPLKRCAWHERAAVIEATIQEEIHAQIVGVPDFEDRVDWAAVREADAWDTVAVMSHRAPAEAPDGWRAAWIDAVRSELAEIGGGR